MPASINVCDDGGIDLWSGICGEVWYGSVPEPPEPPEPLGSFRVGSLSTTDSSSVGSLGSAASSSVGSLGVSARSTVGSLVIEE